MHCPRASRRRSPSRPSPRWDGLCCACPDGSTSFLRYRLRVKLATVKTSVCLNALEYPSTGYSDMTAMSSLHEASILVNLRLRFQQNLIYVRGALIFRGSFSVS